MKCDNQVLQQSQPCKETKRHKATAGFRNPEKKLEIKLQNWSLIEIANWIAKLNCTEIGTEKRI